MGSPARRSIAAELAIAAWAVGGVVAILVDAILRLLPLALEPILLDELSIGIVGALAYVAAILGLGYCEGYRGFALSFSPRTVARALHVGRASLPLVIAGPLVAMGLLHAKPRRLLTSWALLVMIVAFVLLVRQLPAPWRGAVDAGVVVGLGWGVVSLVLGLFRAVRGEPPDIDADWPKHR